MRILILILLIVFCGTVDSAQIDVCSAVAESVIHPLEVDVPLVKLFPPTELVTVFSDTGDVVCDYTRLAHTWIAMVAVWLLLVPLAFSRGVRRYSSGFVLSIVISCATVIPLLVTFMTTNIGGLSIVMSIIIVLSCTMMVITNDGKVSGNRIFFEVIVIMECVMAIYILYFLPNDTFRVLVTGGAVMYIVIISLLLRIFQKKER